MTRRPFLIPHKPVRDETGAIVEWHVDPQFEELRAFCEEIAVGAERKAKAEEVAKRIFYEAIFARGFYSRRYARVVRYGLNKRAGRPPTGLVSEIWRAEAMLIEGRVPVIVERGRLYRINDGDGQASKSMRAIRDAAHRGDHDAFLDAWLYATPFAQHEIMGHVDKPVAILLLTSDGMNEIAVACEAALAEGSQGGRKTHVKDRMVAVCFRAVEILTGKPAKIRWSLRDDANATRFIAGPYGDLVRSIDALFDMGLATNRRLRTVASKINYAGYGQFREAWPPPNLVSNQKQRSRPGGTGRLHNSERSK